jgi:hypothetical protein
MSQVRLSLPMAFASRFEPVNLHLLLPLLDGNDFEATGYSAPD